MSKKKTQLMIKEKTIANAITIAAVITWLYFSGYGMYIAFSNPELTQTQVFFKLLGIL